MLNVSHRKQLYGMFSTLFSYPDPDLLEQLKSGSLLQQAWRIDPADLPAFGGENLLEEMQVAFTDLFINRRGGVPAPPYGSVYLDAGERLVGNSTLAVAAAYREAGLDFAQAIEPPDYLPTELEFLYYLVGKEETGFQRRELATAQAAVGKQARFFRELFLPWVPEFCRRITAEPLAHPLYRWSAGLLARFCTLERDWLNGVARG